MTQTQTIATCPICSRVNNGSTVCDSCNVRINEQLDDLIELWLSAHDELLPAKGGQGARSTEPSIGLNVSALSFIAGDDILHFLHDWEKIIRTDRQLTPPALLAKKPLAEEIMDSVRFHQSHLHWSVDQDWIGDYARELRNLHGQGTAAARRFAQKVRRVACPADNSEGLPCANLIILREDDLLEFFTCHRCKSEWTTYRLIAVALADPRTQFWLDAEAIAAWLDLTPRRVQQIAKEFEVPKKGSLYDLKAILASRHAE